MNETRNFGKHGCQNIRRNENVKFSPWTKNVAKEILAEIHTFWRHLLKY